MRVLQTSAAEVFLCPALVIVPFPGLSQLRVSTSGSATCLLCSNNCRSYLSFQDRLCLRSNCKPKLETEINFEIIHTHGVCTHFNAVGYFGPILFSFVYFIIMEDLTLAIYSSFIHMLLFITTVLVP